MIVSCIKMKWIQYETNNKFSLENDINGYYSSYKQKKSLNYVKFYY